MEKYKVVIIGSGIAGMTSAIYLKRGGIEPLIIEKSAPGGTLNLIPSIENYPGYESISGFELATNMYNQVKKLGGEIKYETVIRVNEDKTVVTNKDTYQATSVIIATGAQNRKLNLPNEKEFIGKGVSYCATCDGNFFKNKIVAVNGGGNTALEDALYLSELAKEVYLIHRRDEFRGDNKYLDEIKAKDNIKIILNSNIISINGNERLESITVKNNSEEETTIEINGLFIAIGQEPKNEIFNNVVDLENGYIKTIDDVHTKTKGIYVAGDTRTKELRQLTTAVSDGSIASSIAIKEMKGDN